MDDAVGSLGRDGSWLTTRAVPGLVHELGDQVEHVAGRRGVELAGRLVGDQELGQAAIAAESATRCCSPPESSRGCASRRSQADAFEQLVGAGLPPRRRLAGEAELDADELARGQLAGEGAPVVLVGVAERASGSAAAQAPSDGTSTSATRTEPAEGRSKPATIRSSVDLPEPLGPRTTQSSPRSTASVRPWSAATPPSARVDAEEILDSTSRSFDRLHPAGRRSRERARRVASRTSAVAADVEDDRGADDAEIHVEDERRLSRGGAGGQPDEVGDDGGEREPRDGAGEEAGDRDRERRSRTSRAAGPATLPAPRGRTARRARRGGRRAR